MNTIRFDRLHRVAVNVAIMQLGKGDVGPRCPPYRYEVFVANAPQATDAIETALLGLRDGIEITDRFDGTTTRYEVVDTQVESAESVSQIPAGKDIYIHQPVGAGV